MAARTSVLFRTGNLDRVLIFLVTPSFLPLTIRKTGLPLRRRQEPLESSLGRSHLAENCQTVQGSLSSITSHNQRGCDLSELGESKSRHVHWQICQFRMQQRGPTLICVSVCRCSFTHFLLAPRLRKGAARKIPVTGWKIGS